MEISSNFIKNILVKIDDKYSFIGNGCILSLDDISEIISKEVNMNIRAGEISNTMTEEEYFHPLVGGILG